MIFKINVKLMIKFYISENPHLKQNVFYKLLNICFSFYRNVIVI